MVRVTAQETVSLLDKLMSLNAQMHSAKSDHKIGLEI
jgi:hypothetical protein